MALAGAQPSVAALGPFSGLPAACQRKRTAWDGSAADGSSASSSAQASSGLGSPTVLNASGDTGSQAQAAKRQRLVEGQPSSAAGQQQQVFSGNSEAQHQQAHAVPGSFPSTPLASVTSATWSSLNSLAAQHSVAPPPPPPPPQQQLYHHQQVAATDSCCCDMQADPSSQQQQQQQQQLLQRANSAPELAGQLAGQADSSWHTTGQQWVQTHGGRWLV